MRKILYNLILILFVIFPINVFAAGGITVSPESLTIEEGSSKTITIAAYNTVGDVYIKSNNSSIATVDNSKWTTGAVGSGETKTGTITVKGVSEGSTTITLTIDAATFDLENLKGQTKTININVVKKTVSEPKTYTVTFNDHNGNKIIDKTCTTSAGGTSCTVSIPTDPVRSDYTFTGWGSSVGCTSGKKSNFSVSANGKYYACYTKNASQEPETPEENKETKTYTITFYNYDGSSKLSEKSCTTNPGKTNCTIGIPNSVSRDGYTFTGWGTSKNCTSGNKGDFVITSNDDYYACYTKNAEPEKPEEKPSEPDNGGNVETNPGTGDITIAIIIFAGLFAIGYAFYYFRKVRED